jgi:protein-glutamine gamma-glutamyltransferase
MPGKTADYLRRLSVPRDIEDSVALRIAVWAAVVLSITALSAQAAINGGLAFAAILLLSGGSYLSWRRRYKRNTIIKIFIAAFTLAALASFLRQVYLQPYDPRLPLAELFLWVQVLHSFDLPRRRDLMLVLISSLILLSLAGSFALSTSFAWLFILWLAAALCSLYFGQRSRLASLSNTPAASKLCAPSWKKLFVMLTILLALISSAGLAIGAVMPRPAFNLLRTLPFSLRRAFNPSSGYQFSNPGYPQLPTRPPEDPLQVNPNAYFGFSTFLDLRARGRLVDSPVMKVRSTEPAYWAGMSFEQYDGYSWTVREEDPELLHASEQPFYLQYDPLEPQFADHDVVQTFYMESEQPNVIFGADRPRLAYFPSDYIYQDSSGLKSPYALSDDVVYSIVSDIVTPKDSEIASRLEVDKKTFGPYLELPRLPQRVLELADSLKTEGATPYRRALAIQAYLQSNYTYSLDVAPLPPGRDAVDYFLFEERQGYCEHFASAFAVLCRLQGIPSRVVTGYATGDYNPFSGLYEVSLDDAHAWVEIYLQGSGWVTMDPTPGFSPPQPSQGSASIWIFGDLFRWMGNRISSILPPSILSGLKASLRATGSFFAAIGRGVAQTAKRLPWLAALFAVLLITSLYYFFKRRRSRPWHSEEALDPASAAMRDFLTALAYLGINREPSQTIEEYGRRLSALVPGLDIGFELGLFEQARYGRQSLGREDVSRVREGLARALEIITSYGKGRHHRGPGGPASRWS